MKKRKPDYLLLIIVVLLVSFGLVMIATVSAPLSLEKFGNTYYYLFHQILFGLLPAAFLGFLCFKIPLKFFKKFSLIFLLINLAFLVFVLMPKYGISIRGASRWVAIGPIAFQPSEFLKITFLLYLAFWLSQKLKGGEKGLVFFAFLIILGILTFLLLKQPDMSTFLILAVTSVLMYFISPTPLWQTLFIILIGIGIFFISIHIMDYQFDRIISFLQKESINPLGKGYQLRQALIAVGSGKLLGVEGILSLGMSKAKFGFLPHSISDSIFAIIGEELGFIGAAVLIFLFLIFLWRGLRISQKSSDGFGKLASFGITVWIIFQAFINIGSMIGILPITGLPLPLISYGSSHLIAELIGIGILLNISKSR